MRLKSYTIHFDEKGQILATETEQVSVKYSTISIKGKTPQLGEEVKIRKGKSVIHAKVTRLTKNGIPLTGEVTYADANLNIDQGQIIEFVGYVLQLLNLLDVIFQKLKSWFGKKPSKMATALSLLCLLPLLASCDTDIRKKEMGKELYKEVKRFEQACEWCLYFDRLRNLSVQVEGDYLGLYGDRYSDSLKKWQPDYFLYKARHLKVLKEYVATQYCRDDLCCEIFFYNN